MKPITQRFASPDFFEVDQAIRSVVVEQVITTEIGVDERPGKSLSPTHVAMTIEAVQNR